MDIQTERGTAMGWFMSGTLIGPALGIISPYHRLQALF